RWRPAASCDARMIWTWRNDPRTRRNSLSQGRISFASHQRWLASKLADDRCALWIAEDASGKPVGQLRLDLSPSGAGVVNIAVAPKRRGQGWGTAMLRGLPKKTGKRRVKRLRAVVKADNLASVMAFLKAGFRFRRLLPNGAYEFEK
ncbi:MAG: GNAT family N-acetyltransferase, partial [Elusimicrobia bacterium]|nr:GNAT family N-acetyltransferase [Elusimicrobiota bacterium]